MNDSERVTTNLSVEITQTFLFEKMTSLPFLPGNSFTDPTVCIFSEMFCSVMSVEVLMENHCKSTYVSPGNITFLFIRFIFTNVSKLLGFMRSSFF